MSIAAPEQFRTGDRVVFTDRQGAVVRTVVRRVVLVEGATKTIRFYKLDGVGVLVSADLEKDGQR